MKYYIKTQLTQSEPFDRPWVIWARDRTDADVTDEVVAYLDTETLADALMAVLTNRSAPFIVGKVYAAATASSSVDDRVWQVVSQWEWRFGTPVRGVTRKAAAIVKYAPDGSWTWQVPSRGYSGSCPFFVEAVIAAETALGITQ